MKRVNCLTYVDKLKWRIRALWITILVMLAYMVVVGEMGGGDSRIMTPLANNVSRVIFFGGLGYVIYRLCHNRKLLRDRLLLKENQLHEQDERNQYLHDKSGGLVMDVLLVLLLSITLTAALFDMTAFNISLLILLIAAGLKAGAYIIYNQLC